MERLLRNCVLSIMATQFVRRGGHPEVRAEWRKVYIETADALGTRFTDLFDPDEMALLRLLASLKYLAAGGASRV